MNARIMPPRPLSSIVILCLSAFALIACGSSSDSGGSSSDSVAEAASRSDADDRKTPAEARANAIRKAIDPPSRLPRITVPSRPPPKHLVVKDLKEGYGAAGEWGQRLSVQYVGVDYKTGKTFEVFWGKTAPFAFNFGNKEVQDGWETGLKGMRVGGRRELIVPSRLAYGTGTLLYVVELLEVS